MVGDKKLKEPAVLAESRMNNRASIEGATLTHTLRDLEMRLGSHYMRQRLRIEKDYDEWQTSAWSSYSFQHLAPAVIRTALKLSGLYGRACRNAERIIVRQNDIRFDRLPSLFDGFTILHISDLHADLNEGAMRNLIHLVGGVRYDVCVLTGDYRAKTFGPFDAALSWIGKLRAQLTEPIFGVLGNYDTIQMVPALESMGIRILLNECETIVRNDQRIYLSGIDDAHFYQLDNIEKASALIPAGGFSILLSHTPEVYREAANADFDLMLSGHTHGGQICLPGAIPVILQAKLPRRIGAGVWQHRGMKGYTSVGAGSSCLPTRLNCLPEIAIHKLLRPSK